MLVLSRRLNEQIVVLHPETREEILSLTVVDLHDGKVRLGFETPGVKLPIFRTEVLEGAGKPAKPLAR